MTWGDFYLHLWAEVNSDKKKEEAERQDACHVAYLLSFPFKPTEPIRPTIYFSYPISFGFLSFPFVPFFSPCFSSFPLVSLRFSSFDFGSVLPILLDQMHGCKEGKGSRGGCSRGHMPLRIRKVSQFLILFFCWFGFLKRSQC